MRGAASSCREPAAIEWFVALFIAFSWCVVIALGGTLQKLQGPLATPPMAHRTAAPAPGFVELMSQYMADLSGPCFTPCDYRTDADEGGSAEHR